MKETLYLQVDEIVVEARQRIDLGDLSNLAESLDKYGLIHPVVVNQEKRLIAGGRRLAAAKTLGWEEIPVVYKETLSDDHLFELELEENVRRKDMTWQERVSSIARIHMLKKKVEALSGRGASNWGTRETGELLGQSHAQIAWALKVASLLEKKDEAISACGSLSEAVQLLIRQKEDEGLRRLHTLSLPAPLCQPDPASAIIGQLGDLEGGAAPFRSGAGAGEAPKDRPFLYSLNPIVLGDALALMGETYREIGNAPFVDHIITDPPYAIDMKNLAQDGTGTKVDRTEAEHDEKENFDLLADFILMAKRVIKPNGFLVMWCDAMNFRWLHDYCIAEEFAVQRWPLIWHKLSPCANSAAAYNTTKNYECVLLARKPGATLIQTTQTSILAHASLGAQKDHPFEKPPEVWEELINLVSFPGQLILDPFSGVGSCPLQCLKMGRRVLSYELVELHYNIQRERIRAFYHETYPNAKNVDTVENGGGPN